MRIGWFSCGITSAVACKIALSMWEDVELYYADTGSHDEDSMRFLRDCEQWFGRKVNIIRSKRYKSHFDVIERKRFVNGPNGAPCTFELKKQPRYDLEDSIKVWDGQNDALRRLQSEINKTKEAIERERGKMLDVEGARETLPMEILALVDSGALTQWRKYPNMFFVPGVDKARIIWDAKKRIVAHKFANTLTDREQRQRFADVYNPLFEIFNKSK